MHSTKVHSSLASTACAAGIFAYCNVGHHFKLTFCMHIAQFMTINQVLDYLLALTLALLTNRVNNIRLDSSGLRSDILIQQKKSGP